MAVPGELVNGRKVRVSAALVGKRVATERLVAVVIEVIDIVVINDSVMIPVLNTPIQQTGGQLNPGIVIAAEVDHEIDSRVHLLVSALATGIGLVIGSRVLLLVHQSPVKGVDHRTGNHVCLLVDIPGTEVGLWRNSQ